MAFSEPDTAERLVGRLSRRVNHVVRHGGARIGLSVALNLSIAYSTDWFLRKIHGNIGHGMRDFFGPFEALFKATAELSNKHFFIANALDKVVDLDVPVAYVPPVVAFIWVLYAWGYASANQPTPATSRGSGKLLTPRGWWVMAGFSCTTAWAVWGVQSAQDLYGDAQMLFDVPVLPFAIASATSIFYVWITFHAVGTLLPVPNMLRRSVGFGALCWGWFDYRRARALVVRRRA